MQARKDLILDTARGYVNSAYGGGNWPQYYDPAYRPDGVGSMPAQVISIDSLVATDENTVVYTVTYRYNHVNSRPDPFTDSGVIHFAESGLIKDAAKS